MTSLLLIDVFPEIFEQIHPVRNGQQFDGSRLSHKSSRRLWWLGDCHHEWLTSVYHRVQGSGCPFCSNKRVLSGFNDLATVDPVVASEWDYDSPLNEGLSPESVLAGNSMKFGFVCHLGHSFVASLKSRTGTLRTGCNVCHNLVVLVGFNDLATVDPVVASEWDYDSKVNEGLSPEVITGKNTRKVAWLCSLGHSFVAAVADRTRVDGKKTGCPYCVNKKVLTGFNDLVTVDPTTAGEWDYSSELNKGLSPETVLAGGRRKFGWVCVKGHKWEAKISNRVHLGQGCPKCSLNQTSKIEEEFRVLFKSELGCGDGVVRVKVNNKNLTVDILGSFQGSPVVVEYDGQYWHQNKKEVDEKKTLQLLDAGFIVVRIRESYRGRTLPVLSVESDKFLPIGFEYYLSDKVSKSKVCAEILGWLKTRF